MKRTIAFDLDGSLETPYFKEADAENVKAWMAAHPAGNDFARMHVVIEACGRELPHFFLNGAFELLQWVHDHGFEIVFFSNAVEERNRALCPILMERAFSDVGKAIPGYRVLSRGDCVDTTRFHDDEKRKLYEGLWFGNYKKKISGCVVPTEDLPNTLMVEDDNSYACKGEERNFVYGVYGGCAQEFISNPKYGGGRGIDFHLPFYFCGMLNRIVQWSEKSGVSLAEAAVQVQYADYGFDFPQDGVRRKTSHSEYLNAPYPPQRDFRIFREGLEELRRYNPGLKFWGDIDENGWGWPKNDDPPPPPKFVKPSVKTDMTKKEADYWLGMLRQTLCKIRNDNVKGVFLEGDEGWEADAHENEWIDFRHGVFSDEPPYFDAKKVHRLRIFGYLPLVRSEEEKRRGSFHYLGQAVNRFDHEVEIFRRVIDYFMRVCFRLEFDWSRMKVNDVENWTIPVSVSS